MRVLSRLRVGQAVGLAAALLAALALAGGIAGALAIDDLTQTRTTLVDEVDPALELFLQGYRVVADQELGARGYVLSGDRTLRERYVLAQREGEEIGRRLSAVLAQPSMRSVVDEAVAVGAAARRWREGYLEPAIAKTDADGRQDDALAIVQGGRTRFRAVRRELDREIAAIRALRSDARASLADASRTVNVVFLTFAAVLVIAGALVVVLIARGVSAPVGRLARQTRRVASGDFDRPISVSGPRDVRGLGADVEAMRRRILTELEELDRRGKDLERSNAELEQFAYVASHDLQEPLRKVASFTQLLQRRYQGQLDEKADQYIEFAVDGAKRMQVLINDLLAFSRVGRIREDFGTVVLEDALRTSLRSLSTAVEESGAEVSHDPLPTVRGEASLLALVLQNLIGNAIKFRRPDEPPRVHVGCRREGDDYELCVRDEGIGIDPQYAERIFVIFQRLHPKEDYVGTGIGLAMCRKVVEYHGGRIWLDTDAPGGTTFRFTLPVPPDHQEPDA